MIGVCVMVGVRPHLIGLLLLSVSSVLSIFQGPCGDGEQRRITLPAGDWKDQEPLVPQPNAGYEHWEKAGPEQQERGENHT